MGYHGPVRCRQDPHHLEQSPQPTDLSKQSKDLYLIYSTGRVYNFQSSEHRLYSQLSKFSVHFEATSYVRK